MAPTFLRRDWLIFLFGIFLVFFSVLGILEFIDHFLNICLTGLIAILGQAVFILLIATAAYSEAGRSFAPLTIARGFQALLGWGVGGAAWLTYVLFQSSRLQARGVGGVALQNALVCNFTPSLLPDLDLTHIFRSVVRLLFFFPTVLFSLMAAHLALSPASPYLPLQEQKFVVPEVHGRGVVVVIEMKPFQ